MVLVKNVIKAALHDKLKARLDHNLDAHFSWRLDFPARLDQNDGERETIDPLMRTNFKPSVSSRASVRSLVVACLPAAAIAFVANSPALGAAISSATNHDLTVDDNTGTGTNGPATNDPSTNDGSANDGSATNPPPPICVTGMRG